MIHRRVDRREGAEHPIRREALFKRRVALGIKRLGVGHTAAHPEDDHGVGGGLDPLPGRLGQYLAGAPAASAPSVAAAGGLEKSRRFRRPC